MKIIFVVLNYKTAESTIRAVESIVALHKKTTHEINILLVDNGSRDKSWEKLSNRFSDNSEIELIQNRKNLGFAGAQSKLKKIIQRYDYACLVNSDAVLDKDWLRHGLADFKKNPNLAAVGGKAFDWGKEAPSYSTKNNFYSYQIIDPIDVNSTTLRSGEKLKNVDIISGAGLMLDVKKSILVGYFNKKYFLYYEESDLEARLTRAGYDVCYDPKMHIWHKVGLSSETGKHALNKVMFYYMYRNRFLFAFTNFDKAYSNLFAQRYIVSSLKLVKPGNKNLSRQEKWLILKSLTWILLNLPYILNLRKRNYRLGVTYSNKLAALNDDNSVTVVIPCYNYAQYLEECVDSVLDQTHRASKIIIINDGSTDNTEEILSKYSEIPTILTYSNKNKGVVEAKNFGLSKTETKWVIFLDADDSIQPNYIQDVLERASRDKLDLVYTDSYLTGAKNELIEYQEFDFKQLYNFNYIHNSALMRTDIIKYIGGYQIKEGYEDWEMYIRYSKFTQRIARIPQPLLNYRQHEGQMSRNAQANSIDYQLRSLVQDKHPFNSFRSLNEPYILKSSTNLATLLFIKKIIKKPYLLFLSPVLLIYIPLRLVKDILHILFIYTMKFYKIDIADNEC